MSSATNTPTQKALVWPAAQLASMIASFEWKPAKLNAVLPKMPGMPTPVMASVPNIIVQKVIDASPEVAIEAHVLPMVHRMDHRAGTQEQQCL